MDIANIKFNKVISPQKHVYLYKYLLHLQKDKMSHEVLYSLYRTSQIFCVVYIWFPWILFTILTLEVSITKYMQTFCHVHLKCQFDLASVVYKRPVGEGAR